MEPFSLPLKCVQGYIFDANDRMVAEIRGWGYLTGEMGLPFDEAYAIQERIGTYFANLCNKESEELGEHTFSFQNRG